MSEAAAQKAMEEPASVGAPNITIDVPIYSHVMIECLDGTITNLSNLLMGVNIRKVHLVSEFNFTKEKFKVDGDDRSFEIDCTVRPILLPGMSLGEFPKILSKELKERVLEEFKRRGKNLLKEQSQEGSRTMTIGFGGKFFFCDIFGKP